MINKRFRFVAIGINIIGVIILGFYLGALFFRTTYVVEKHDSVKLEYTVWVSDESEAYNPLDPVFDAILVIKMTPITEDSEDGLILGLYSNLLGKKIGFESGLIWLNKCIDQNRDGVDDVTGQPALTYGNSSYLYFNTPLMLQFRVVDISKPEPPIFLNPYVITGIIVIMGLLWISIYIGVYVVKRKPEIATDTLSKPKVVYKYDKDTSFLMRQKNKGTRHDKEGFANRVLVYGAESLFNFPFLISIFDTDLKLRS